jgi:TonB family protein
MRTTNPLFFFVSILIAVFGAGCAAVPFTAEEAAAKQRILHDIADEGLARQMTTVALTRIQGGPNFYGSKTVASYQKERPIPLSMPKPVYPVALRKARVQALVWIAFVIDAQGYTSDVQSLSETQPEFSTAAITAVKEWRFRPAIIDGKPRPTRTLLPIGFTLD